jgi:hypothetical protein
MWKASMLRNWELGEQGHAPNGAWARRLLAPRLLVLEEFDVLKSSALAALRLLLPVIRKAATTSCGSPPQVMLTSATATNSGELRDLLLPKGEVIEGGGRHGRIHIVAVSRFQRSLHGWEDKLSDLLQSCIEPNPHHTIPKRTLVIIDNRQLAEQLFQKLKLANQGFGIVHGNLDAKKNRMTVGRFKRGELRGLLATTIINRGIDVGDLDLLILVGMPVGGLRDVVQSLGRVARPPDSVGVVYHLLDRRRAQEDAFARDPRRLEALYRGTVAPVLVPLDRHHALRLAILAALLLGCRTRDELPSILPPETGEWLPSVIVNLRAEGLLRYAPNQLTVTSISGDQIHRLPLRASQRRFTIRAAETGERLGQLDVQQVPRVGLPHDLLLHGGKQYQVVAATSTEVLVTPAALAEGMTHAVSDNRTENSLALAIRGLYNFGALSFEFCDVYPRITTTTRILRNLQNEAAVTESPIAPADQVHFSLDPIEGFAIQTSFTEIPAAQTLAYAMLATAYIEPPTDLQVLTTHDRVIVADRAGSVGSARDLYQHLPNLLPQVITRLRTCSCRQAGCPVCVYLAAPPTWSTDHNCIQQTLSLLQKQCHMLEKGSEGSRLNQLSYAPGGREPPATCGFSKSIFSCVETRREVEVVFADLHIGHPDSHWQRAITCLAQLVKRYRIFGVYFAGDTAELRFAEEAASRRDEHAQTLHLAKGWQIVGSAFDEFTGRLQRLGVENRCIFITGNHDTRLELLPESHGLTITQDAHLNCSSFSVHVLHGHGLGFEAAVQRCGPGAAALRCVRERLQ